MYAWARDAPTLKLPNGVGFKVGGNSNINYLVLQVHYHRMFEGKYYLNKTGSHLIKAIKLIHFNSHSLHR